MLSFYKFCISRGMFMGNIVFLFTYGYMAGLVLLYLVGGMEFVTFKPHLVWKSLYQYLSQWKAGTIGEVGSTLAIAMISPLFIGSSIRLCFRLITYPMRKRRARLEAMKPKPKTAEERIEELETKISEMQQEQPEEETENKENETATKETTEEKPSVVASEQTISEEPNVAEKDEVLITPPPAKTVSDTYHPPSIDQDALKKRVLRPSQESE